MPCHDVAFYNYIESDMKQGMSMEDRFGSKKNFSRNELLKLTPYFDGVLAVGDWVKKEYKYLIPKSDPKKVHICYNGTPTPSSSYSKKLAARKKIKTYCENLFNFTPDVIMTHVTRLVISKGLWRDISMLEELDKKFTQHKIKGFYVMLSSLLGNGRSDEEAARMEEYGWPIMHKDGYPDLMDYEKDVYWSVAYFNAKSKSIKAVFINQFGFTPQRVGKRLPQGTTFQDLRLASDAEFGMSVYEPFGIAQIETVPFGGVAILTRVCGSAFLLEKTFADEKKKPYFVIDFANTGDSYNLDWKSQPAEARVNVEKKRISNNIHRIFATIPKTEEELEEL
jgi:hypothetical protein